MRILFLADVSIERVIGGAERVLHEQATRLAQRGHQVYVLTRLLPEHESKSKVIGKVHEWRYSVDYKNAITLLFSTRVNAPFVLSQLLQEGVFNVVNGHQPFTSWAFLCTPFAQKMPFIYTCHSLAFEEFLSRNPQPVQLVKMLLYRLKMIALRRMEKDVLMRSHHIITLSEYTQKKLQAAHNISEHKINIIPGGVDTDRFRPLSDRYETRRNLGLPLDRPVIITVRNLVSRMGLENLIAATGEIKKAFPEFSLIIGGTGPLKDTLEEMVTRLNLSKHVSFLGFIPEDKLPLYLGAADYFILPTINLEGFGLVTVEALACGTPVLGTSIGGTVEILTPLDERLLIPSPASESIAAAIIDHMRLWTRDQTAYLKLRERCRHYVEERYSWEVNIEKTEELFFRMAR
ncbi:MAG: glycosyltransferase family 4 protein [Syntrophales bacterium]|nr:glycosyltransferase family 4 protein [Syntrophales bacterium]